ncbi:MAG: LysR family transcriptional regulator [Desulfobulbaceae bacterium]|nr:LysR family transcriptional regulator [Desulfobulbaceae bacterium]
MEIRKLEVFCKVVELKSFTRTAEAILLSQPTVSEHIRSLERELDQKLVDRLGREVEPTPVGRLLYKYARKILRLQHEAREAVEQYSGNLIGRIMIGCGTIPGTYILPVLIGTFRKQHPSIKATLRITSSRFIAKKVLEGELELGVVGAKWNESGLNWTKVFSDELTLAVHPDHPWAVKKSVSLEDVVNEPFILREPGSGTRKVIAQVLEKSGFREAGLQEVAEIGYTAAIKEAVKSGIGVSILSRRAVMDDVDCGRLVTVAVDGLRLQRPFYLIQRKNRELPPAATVFLDYLLQAAEKEGRKKA